MQLVWVAMMVSMVSVATVTSVDIRVGYSTRPFKFVPALISLGLKRARNEGLLLDHNVTLAYRTSSCDPVDIVAAEIQLVNDENVDVIMGRTCGKGCIAVGYYHTYYKMPRIPTACSEPTLTDKSSFPTFVRCMSSSDKVSRAIEQVYLKYGWGRTALMYRNSGTCEYGIRDSRKRFQNINVTVTDLMELPDGPYLITDDLIRRYLITMKERARVMLVCHRWSVIRRIMLIAQELGMEAPNYVFLAFQFLPSTQTTRPWLQPGVNVSDTQAARDKTAFRALKQISMASFDPGIYANFHETVKIESDKKPWNITVDELSDNNYLMFLVDCSYLYFTALHELLAEGADYRDGRLIFHKAKNRTFQGVTGRVVINDNADRDPDYWVWDCPPEAAQCRPYSYVTTSSPVAMEDFLEPYWGTEDGKHPPDKPKCGFRDEFCPENQNTTTIIGCVAAVVIVIGMALGFGYYKRQEYREKQLHMMTWKVDYKDIDFSGKLGDTSMRSMKSMSSIMGKSRGSISALTTNEQLFTKVGMLNGAVVAVKHVNKSAVNVNRELLVELKTMKELVHENINQFIGACVDPPDICVLTYYCTKGSLQDVIENDDITLDWMFKSSLIRDLINGMCYLVTTKIHSHGSLRSSCCMIDGRWMLKIAGFGLTTFKAGAINKDESEFKKYQKLLSTAPELLRLGESERPVQGTEKGDVYSFAVIMQEVIFRAAPYFGVMSPQDIVGRLKKLQEPPWRPVCPEVAANSGIRSEVVTLMERCWNEDPHSRPAFHEIRKIFKILYKGTNTNIMDNMIRMMEKYASNLEGLVQQRTGELLDEKKKTDILLYRMLPPSVVEQLKGGLSIIPEMYENVTIYFSDIVGFTSLSSSSTPMEVVDLLNDLYTTFDATIEIYDVYKVETIGDAYMVVSGVPRRNGANHAPEIADMALSLLKQVLTFKIRHLPDLTLNLRIGLHTGSCAAGVVGQTMPRFCLFGDTVNMASRMESTGEAQKIHISENTKNILESTGRYTIELRGNTDVKGKGLLTTYWLQPKAGTG